MTRTLLCAALLASCGSTAVNETSPPEHLRVAACQIRVEPDPEQSWAALECALEQAAEQGAQLACLPETCLMGWVNPEAHELASPIPGPATERLGELARRHGIMIAVGIAERSGEGLHDSAVLIDADGALLLRHRKVNVLSELMTPPYTPGRVEDVAVAETRFGRIGLLICADTFEAPVVAALAALEPDLVLVPYGWAAPAAAWPDHGRSLHAWIEHTARATGAPVVGVDAVGAVHHGPWKGYVYGGQSAVCGADGESLAVLADREAEVRVFEVALARD